VLAAGADSAAVVADIQQAADPVARTRQWLAVARAGDIGQGTDRAGRGGGHDDIASGRDDA